ncbi:MAG: hypothetical protein Q8K32_11140 [Archangium sp.]|nr:hypothetical protein [Archangium sp.]
MSDRDTIVVLQRQAQETEIARLRLDEALVRFEQERTELFEAILGPEAVPGEHADSEVSDIRRFLKEREEKLEAANNERDQALAALRAVFPYAESRVEDILEELVLLETGVVQVEQPQAEWRANANAAVKALEDAEALLRCR